MTEAVAKSSFQELIESVEALPFEDQEILGRNYKQTHH